MEHGLVHAMRALSSLARTGWMLRGVPGCMAESVAEHSFRAALIAFEIAARMRERGAHVDPYRTAVIALFHDVAESIVGDIAKVSGISEEEKERAEIRAFNSLGLSQSAKDVYHEFMNRSSPEARVAKLAEVLATLVKALEYERLGFDVSDIRDNMKSGARALAEEMGVEEVVREVLGPII